MLKQYRCKCDSPYENGGFCPQCNSQRIEVINDQLVEEILKQKQIQTGAPQLDALSNVFYGSQYCRYLDHLKRILPLSYSKRLDDAIEYVQRQMLFVSTDQRFSNAIKEESARTRMAEMHQQMTQQLKTAQKFTSELAYIDQLKLYAQINAIEQIFNQFQYYEKKEA